METKDLIGLALIFLAIPTSVLACCVSRRARDAAFFLMTAGVVLTEKLDINFVTRYWYRGTTRGFEFTFIDILAIGVLVSSLLVPRPGQSRGFWPASLGALLLYLFYGCFSVAISEPKLFGLFEITKILRGILLFLAAAWFVRSERELAILVLALACGVCFEGALAVKQRVLGGVYRVPGSLDHSNSLCAYLCLAGPVLVAAATSNLPKRLRWFSALALAAAGVAIVLTISRAGIPIFALVTLGATAFCVSWRITLKKTAVAALICLVSSGLLFKSWHLLADRFGQASLEQEFLDENSEGRGMYLRQARAIVEDRFFGVGLNNWSYWISKKYGATLGERYEDYDDIEYSPSKEILPSINYAAPAHNLGALTIGELGWPGLFIFMALWLRWLQMGSSFLWRRSPEALHRLGVGFCFGICGVFLQSLTEWVYRQTQVMFAVHVLLGALASLYHFKRKPRQRALQSRPQPCVTTAPFEPVASGS